MTIKPIPTRYDGILYRSRAEARWAVFFASQGVPFRYEEEGYQTRRGWYLPDFRLTQADVFFEVKPDHPTPDEMDKASALAFGTGRPMFVAAGPPDLGTVVWRVFPDRLRQEWRWACESGDDRVAYLLCGEQDLPPVGFRLREDVTDLPDQYRLPTAALEAAGRYQFQ